MSVGDKVKYTLGDIEYLAIIISKNTKTNIYQISVEGLGKVIESDGSNITKL